MPKHLTQGREEAARRSAHATAEDFGIKISNPDRVIFPEHRPDQERPRRLLCGDRAADHGRRREAADDPDPLPAGPHRRSASSRSTTSGTFGPHVKHIPIKEKDGDDRGLSLFRRHPRPARLRADGHDRIPRLGQQGRQGRISRPAGVRPRSRRRPRLRQGEGRGGSAEGAARRPRPQDLPAAVGRQGHPRRRAARCIEGLADGQELRRALQPRDRRGRAGDVHRQHPQGPAQGPHLPRLAAQPARRDRGHALLRPRPRRRAGVGAGRLGGARPI